MLDKEYGIKKSWPLGAGAIGLITQLFIPLGQLQPPSGYVFVTTNGGLSFVTTNNGANRVTVRIS